MRSRIVLGISLVLLFFSLSWAKDVPQAIPADFKVTAVAGGVLPWTNSAKIEISSDGTGIYSNAGADDRAEGVFKEVGTFHLDAEHMKAIYQTIRQNGFFDLKRIYEAENFVDGSFAELTITSGGKIHSVHTANYDLKEFDDIIRKLNEAVPKEFQLDYDALHGEPAVITRGIQ